MLQKDLEVSPMDPILCHFMHDRSVCQGQTMLQTPRNITWCFPGKWRPQTTYHMTVASPKLQGRFWLCDPWEVTTLEADRQNMPYPILCKYWIHLLYKPSLFQKAELLLRNHRDEEESNRLVNSGCAWFQSTPCCLIPDILLVICWGLRENGVEPHC